MFVRVDYMKCGENEWISVKAIKIIEVSSMDDVANELDCNLHCRPE